MGFFDSIRSAFGLRKKQARDEAPIDDDDERDPELEARDDRAGFDFEGDIARYFTAEFRIDMAWADHERRAALFREYAIRDVAHWYQVKATFERWLETPEAKAVYETPKDLMLARMTTTQTMSLDDLALGDPAKAEPELGPIDGVDLQSWAKAEAALAGGATVKEIARELGVGAAGWAEVSAGWHARMERDGSAKIAAEYSRHVGNAGVGKLEAARGKGADDKSSV